MKKVLIAIAALAALVVFWVIAQVFWLGGTAVNSAKGVVRQTLDPNNVVFQYEHFHDLCHDILAYNSQIDTAKQVLATDQANKPNNDPFGQYSQGLQRDETNIQGLENERDNVAQAYNSDSHKINRTIFKSHNLPASIDPPTYTLNCEYVPN